MFAGPGESAGQSGGERGERGRDVGRGYGSGPVDCSGVLAEPDGEVVVLHCGEGGVQVLEDVGFCEGMVGWYIALGC